jgi:hypothetical protein
MKSDRLFYEKQSLPLRRIAFTLAIPPCAMLALLVWQVMLGHSWGGHPMSNGNVIGWTIFLWIIYVRLLTVRLVTEVRGGELVVRLRGLWRAHHVRLNDIQSIDTITFDPRDYGGYGIRSTRQGMAYIASDNQGLKMKLRSGAELVLGSERPAELTRVLRAHVGMFEISDGDH